MLCFNNLKLKLKAFKNTPVNQSLCSHHYCKEGSLNLPPEWHHRTGSEVRGRSLPQPIRSLALGTFALWFKQSVQRGHGGRCILVCFSIKVKSWNVIISGNGKHKLTGAIGEEFHSTGACCRRVVNPFFSRFTGHINMTARCQVAQV